METLSNMSAQYSNMSGGENEGMVGQNRVYQILLSDIATIRSKEMIFNKVIANDQFSA